jgi:hypothetical protein
MVVRCVDVGKIDDHLCLSFLFIVVKVSLLVEFE